MKIYASAILIASFAILTNAAPHHRITFTNNHNSTIYPRNATIADGAYDPTSSCPDPNPRCAFTKMPTCTHECGGESNWPMQGKCHGDNVHCLCGLTAPIDFGTACIYRSSCAPEDKEVARRVMGTMCRWQRELDDRASAGRLDVEDAKKKAESEKGAKETAEKAAKYEDNEETMNKLEEEKRRLEEEASKQAEEMKREHDKAIAILEDEKNKLEGHKKKDQKDARKTAEDLKKQYDKMEAEKKKAEDQFRKSTEDAKKGAELSAQKIFLDHREEFRVSMLKAEQILTHVIEKSGRGWWSYNREFEIMRENMHIHDQAKIAAVLAAFEEYSDLLKLIRRIMKNHDQKEEARRISAVKMAMKKIYDSGDYEKTCRLEKAFVSAWFVLGSLSEINILQIDGWTLPMDKWEEYWRLAEGNAWSAPRGFIVNIMQNLVD